MTLDFLFLAPVERNAFERAAEMIQEHHHGLRAGDALHLAVALELGANQMATLDTTLAGTAKRLGIDVCVFNQAP